MALVREACAAGARLEAACAVLGVSARSLQRWTEGGGVKEDGRLAAGRVRTPANKLSREERQRIVATANSAEFASLPPSQIVPRLADQGEYLASESSFYRILREAGQLPHRGFGLGPEPPQAARLGCRRPQPTVELGHHLPGQHGGGLVFLPLPDHGRVQPQGRGLGGPHRADRRACLRVVPQGPFARGGGGRGIGAALRQRLAHERGDPAGHPATAGGRAVVQPALGEQRQPLFGGVVQPLQVPPRLSRQTVRKPGARTGVVGRFRPLVQRRTPPQRHPLRHPRRTPHWG